MSSSTAAAARGNDWMPAQYLVFQKARGRPIQDLITFLTQSDISPRRIVDLGCGPGNSTEALASAFPGANISGMDSSPAMLEQARKILPSVEFAQGDLQTYTPDPDADLLFSNAVFHWLRHKDRIVTMVRLLAGLKKGGVLAIQVPDNYSEPSHRAMRQTASSEPFWSDCFQFLKGPEDKPELDPIEEAREYYDRLIPYCEHVEIWHTIYRHVLDGHGKIVDWVRSTGLQPFINALPAEGNARQHFLDNYQMRLEKKYEMLANGKVMLTYPRLFVVAFRGDATQNDSVSDEL